MIVATTARQPQPASDGAAGAPAPARPAARASVAPEVAMAPARALVVDDNDMVRDLVSRVLRGAGLAVDVAASAKDALALPVASYQVFVIDVRLGASSGTELIEQMRAQDPTVPSRCLLLTGGTDADLPEGIAVLFKPFLANDLIAAVTDLRVAAQPPRAVGGPDAGTRPDVASATITTTDRGPGQS